MTITVSTDGSALGNPNGSMGWAWADHASNAARTPGHQHDGDSDAGGATNGTNQIGELCAVLEALRAHTGAEPLTIETDSQYAINCSTKWVHGWKKNGWKNSQKKPVKNAPLIKAIDAEISRREGPVKFVWVKGHNGNPGNEKVDDLAHTYSGDARSGVKTGYLPLEGWQSLLGSEYARGVDIPADARMLMDGKITAEQYHLGRGEGTGGGDGNNASERAIEGAATAQSAPKTSLKQQLAEPEGVPDYDFGNHQNGQDSASYDTDAAQADSDGTGNDIDNMQVNASAADANSSDDSSDSADTGDARRAQDGNDSGAESANAEPSDTQTAESTSSSESRGSDESAEPSESDEPGQKATPRQPAPRLTVSGLNVTGTVRVTPPPSSSPTYNGHPRRIRGAIHIDGTVDGDGTLRLNNTPLFIDLE